MKLSYKDRVISTAVVMALAGILVALAVLQYRWSGQVSEATSERMKANLQASMIHFREGLARELGGIALALHFDSRSTEPAVYVRQIEQWKQSSAYPDLVANVYIWRSAGRQSQFLRLNSKTLKFEPCDGPSGFDKLTQPLQEFASRAAATHQETQKGNVTVAQARPSPPESKQPRDARSSSPSARPDTTVAAMRTPGRGYAAPHPPSASSSTESGNSTLASAAAPRLSTARTANGNVPLREGEAARLPEQAWMKKRRSGGWLLGQDGSSPFAGPSQHQRVFSAFNRMLNRQTFMNEVGAPAPRRQMVVSTPNSQAAESNLLHGDWRIEYGPHLVFERPSPRQLMDGNTALPSQYIADPDASLIAGNAIRPASVGLAMPSRRQAQMPMSRQGNGKPAPMRAHLAPWFIDERIPALLRPLFSEPGSRRMDASEGDWIIVELNRKVMQERIFPEFAERYFAGPQGSIYDVAVRSEAQKELIYSSGSGFGKPGNEREDARLALFGTLGGPGGPGGPARVFFAADRAPREQLPDAKASWPGYRLAGSMLLPFQSGMTGGWELLVRHRKGSLEAAVAGLRHRNLAMSFGVLLILGVTMAMVIVTTRRAQRLAMLQMEFVAGVSHELRTPLAVISSAADNIADGIVSDKTKLARYGRLIREHTRQLNSLIEQILSFASTQKKNHQYNLVRAQLPEILQSAMKNSAEMIRSAGFTVEQEIDPNLPDVVVDVPAVTHCLQNLISNAVKYGGEPRWIGMRACATDKEVCISVQDKGIGIETSELQRIFDPFYRTPAVVAAQIHGTGLGLALARTMAEAVGGRLTVTSKLGKGSTFTLHLPCAGQHTGSDETASAVAASSLQ